MYLATGKGTEGGAPDAVHTQCGYLATSMGKVLCCHLDLSFCAVHVCGCTFLRPQRATAGEGPFPRL